MYLRFTTVAASDGSLALILMPDATNFLGYASGGFAVVNSWTYAAASNVGFLENNALAARPISLGLRARAQVAMTVAPGRIFAGYFHQTDRTIINACSPQDLANFPVTKVFPGYGEVMAVGRPSDTQSFEFLPVTISGYPAGGDFNFSTPYLVFTGLPGGASVDIDCVCNIECTPLQQHGEAFQTVGVGETGPSLSDTGLSIEQLYKSIGNKLPPPAAVSNRDTTENWFNAATGSLAAAGVALGAPLAVAMAKKAQRGYRGLSSLVHSFENVNIDQIIA